MNGSYYQTPVFINDMERDNWKTSFEAKEYGLIDKIGYPEYA